MPEVLTDRIVSLCQSESISSLLAKNPSRSPGSIQNDLFGKRHPHIFGEREPKAIERATKAGLERARKCGKFKNSEPSELFLRLFHDALLPIDADPRVGCVSPCLMGATGVVPATIAGTMLDCVRHIANLIARAESEVLLATNYWVGSRASDVLREALKELSRRAGERGQKANVKIIYDRGHLKQFIQNHTMVSEREYTHSSLNLPPASEIPNVSMQVMNYHRPAMGTFHAKFLVVDRKVGVVGSNNIQNNENFEMMVHLEGDIVDSIYDNFIISWHEALDPPLETLTRPASTQRPPTFEDPEFGKFAENFKIDLSRPQEPRMSDELARSPREFSFSQSIQDEVRTVQKLLSPGQGMSAIDALSHHLNEPFGGDVKTALPDDTPVQFFPLKLHKPHAPVAMALVNRNPWAAPNNSSIHTPQNEAWLSAFRNARHSIFIQTPDLNASVLQPAILDAVKRGIIVTLHLCLGYNDAGEMLPGQGGVNETTVARLRRKARESGEDVAGRLVVQWYVAADQDRPIWAGHKKRSCHTKLMIVDGEVGITGSGNQDTQSWAHSQEINVMIDSKEICREWMDLLEKNQNSRIYGISQDDGIWRDKEGREAEGATGADPGRFASLKGLVGAVQRVRGLGGF
ncbi:phospholipase D [Eremomyces bilateralis CBS 781.70]|uniref:Phospholipase D n=1 Tax=Eremomyces bilateralis CBS 781.70 TaxID=1392243 RepID=A0A6G1GHV3_9PEZI|nr:phospholipase D [Eremomyces bilateralis CBS 781.70]KAF1817633.1 phospholipase D [Eremomyces bilateralis CBS 781.70]